MERYRVINKCGDRITVESLKACLILGWIVFACDDHYLDVDHSCMTE